MIKNLMRSFGVPLATFVLAGTMGILAQPGPSSAVTRKAQDTTGPKDLNLAAGGRVVSFDAAAPGADDNNADALAIVGTKADLYAFYASAFLDMNPVPEKPVKGTELADNEKAVRATTAVVDDVITKWHFKGPKGAVGKIRIVNKANESLFENVSDEEQHIHSVKFHRGARGTDRFGYRWRVVINATVLLSWDVGIKKGDKKPGTSIQIPDQLCEQVTGDFLVDGAHVLVDAPETCSKK